MEILSKLFGGKGIVKILRLFLFNPEMGFESRDVAKRTRTESDIVRSELSTLEKIGFIEKKRFYKEVESSVLTRRRSVRSRKEGKPARRRVSGWFLNQDFAYLEELRALLIGSSPLAEDDIVRRIRKTGDIKVIIIGGVFLQHWDSRLDILIVADKPKEGQLTNVIKGIEAEIGREIRYAIFSTSDFQYRLSIYDRLVRDVLDYPHRAVVDRIGVA
jgi:hypothetical protein